MARTPRTEAGQRMLDWFGGPMRPGEARNLQSAILAIEAEAEGAGFAAALMNVARSEAQDTAASSGLRELFDPTSELDRIASWLVVAPEHRDRMERWEHGDFTDDSTPNLAATDRLLLIQQIDRARNGVEELRGEYTALRTALAQPTPEPRDWHEIHFPVTPEPSLRDEQEANSAAWHESIRRAQAAKDAATPEPSLRDALTAALRKVEPPEPDFAIVAEANGFDVSWEGWADAIIAALPGLSLSAQPSEPGETA